jgi:uncharacterized protein (DUF2126 family)
VIEVNIHPAGDWDELKHNVETLYEERGSRAWARRSSCSTAATRARAAATT